jgi:hypothetical protein
MVIHLAQPALGIRLIRRHDADVVDPLTAARLDVETVSDHRTPLPAIHVSAQ